MILRIALSIAWSLWWFLAGVALIIATLLGIGPVTQATGADAPWTDKAFVTLLLLWGLSTGLALMSMPVLLALRPKFVRSLAEWILQIYETQASKSHSEKRPLG